MNYDTDGGDVTVSINPILQLFNKLVIREISEIRS